MFESRGRATAKQKKIRMIIAACAVAVCLLVELLGRIPGIPFNGWQDIFSAAGMPQESVIPEGKLEVHFIDVGNADCILVRQGEHNLLIDSGEINFREKILDYLRRHGVTKLDLVIATHPHADHIGSMPTILEEFSVKRFIMAYMPEGKEPTTTVYAKMLEQLYDKDVPVDEAEPGAVYKLGTARLQVLAPLSESDDTNDMSVVTRLTFGKRSFLFTGDAESVVERQIMTKGYTLKADVLKLGHHGSRNATSKAFLRKVDPAYAVITCGKNNSYNHPHDETIYRLDEEGIPYYRSDVEGDIVFATDGKNLTVKTQREE